MGITPYLNPDAIKDRDISASKISAMSKSITWGELKTMRDAGKLTPGMQYRITDYTCTTTQSNTRSAGHVFDIIVTADDEGTLNEVARAAKHDGDTYFANNDLSAWKIWYCLDNDTDRFVWADGTNGKGIIYRMIDEWNNDIPYDFKNIQFKHPDDTTTYPYYYYTFASSNVESNTDYSLSIFNRCDSNTIREYLYYNGKRLLNNIIFIGYNYYSNYFGVNCYNNSFIKGASFNSFGSNCYSNSFKSDFSYNSIGDYFYSNSFSKSANYNSFRDFCYSNQFGKLSYNSFGNNCSYFDTRYGTCSSNFFGKYPHPGSF